MNVKPAIWVVATALAAQPPGPGRMSPLQAALDLDKDGTLSAQEIQTAPLSLKKLDKNADGQITPDELRPVGGPPQQQGPSPSDLVDSLMAFDKNGDGKLAKSELPERLQGLFERGDANKDGFLSREELTALAAAQKPPEEPRRENGPQRRVEPLMGALDLDSDGTLSATEIAKAPESLLKLDKNGDGTLTSDEFRPQMNRPQGPPPQQN